MIIDITLARPASDAGASATVMDIFEALRGWVVDLTLTNNNNGYPSENVYIERVDNDGDVVVCELDNTGTPQTNATYAIPQANIARVRCPTGDDA